jgi:hypothetical protein
VLKTIVKLVLLGGPASFFAWAVLSTTLASMRTDALLATADGLVWGEGPSAVRVSVTETEEGEALRFRVVARSAGRELFARDFAVDRDMWGGGFVRAVQADEDPELEVLAWGLHEQDKTSFLLDHVDGAVEEKPSGAVWGVHDRAREWHQAHAVDPLGLVFFGILLAGYYLVVGVVWAIVRAARRRPALPESIPGASA